MADATPFPIDATFHSAVLRRSGCSTLRNDTLHRSALSNLLEMAHR
jgi:hypothetical protein